MALKGKEIGYAVLDEQKFMQDEVNSPSHYRGTYGIECADAIRNALTPEEWRGYCKGNIIKYTWRERGKNGDQDISKAGRYIEMLGER